MQQLRAGKLCTARCLALSCPGVSVPGSWPEALLQIMLVFVTIYEAGQDRETISVAADPSDTLDSLRMSVWQKAGSIVLPVQCKCDSHCCHTALNFLINMKVSSSFCCMRSTVRYGRPAARQKAYLPQSCNENAAKPCPDQLGSLES